MRAGMRIALLPAGIVHEPCRLGDGCWNPTGGPLNMAKRSRGGRMTAAKKRAAKTRGGRGLVKNRKAGRTIMKT